MAVQQAKGSYEVKIERLRQYIHLYHKLKVDFQEVKLKKIPRAENKKIDELARMVNACISWKVEEPIVQVELIVQVDQPPISADWQTQIVSYLKDEKSSEDLQ